MLPKRFEVWPLEPCVADFSGVCIAEPNWPGCVWLSLEFFPNVKPVELALLPPPNKEPAVFPALVAGVELLAADVC